VLLNAYATGGTIRTVVNQANAMSKDHEVELASVYRTRETPVFDLAPGVRLVPLTDLWGNGRRRLDPPEVQSRFMNKTRRLKNPLPHRHDFRFKRWDPMVDAAVIRYFRAEKDGILVTTRPGLNLMSAYFAPSRLIRIGQDHMNLGSYKPPLREAILKAYPRLDLVSVLTDHDRQAYETAFEGRGVRFETVPNGVAPWRLPPAALQSKVVVAAGRMVQQKGFDLLVEAFALVAARHPDWQLKIFGSGKGKDALAAQIKDLGLDGTVLLAGEARKLDEQLAAAAMYVLSSRYEGLPMVLLEAITAGLPVVSFDCPTGPAEIIADGRNGLLIPPEDPAKLAAGICELIEHPEKRRDMGAAALESSRRYSMSTVKEQWEQLFSELKAAQ
jgi:glycosyltransferase involved in cell wall biosynthesis